MDLRVSPLRHYSVLWNVERVTVSRIWNSERRRSIVIASLSSGIIVDVNSAFSATTGYSRAEVVGQTRKFAEILSAARHGTGFIGSKSFAEVSQAGKWEGEIWIRGKRRNANSSLGFRSAVQSVNRRPSSRSSWSSTT